MRTGLGEIHRGIAADVEAVTYTSDDVSGYNTHTIENAAPNPATLISVFISLGPNLPFTPAAVTAVSNTTTGGGVRTLVITGGRTAILAGCFSRIRIVVDSSSVGPVAAGEVSVLHGNV